MIYFEKRPAVILINSEQKRELTKRNDFSFNQNAPLFSKC